MSYIPINKGQFTLETPEREAAFERHRGAGCEEAYRENRRQWAEFPRTRHLADYPLHVDLELASLCNLRCPMCYTITADFRRRVNAKLMDYDLFTRLVDECAAGGVYSIRLSLRGEAFLHPRIVDCIRYAKSKGIKEVSTLTNGGRLDEAMFTEIMEAGLDWLTVSIDGIGKVYDEIRRPLKFDRMVEKLGNFKRIKEEAGQVKPVVKVQTVLPAIEADPQAYYDIFAPIVDLVSANPLIGYTDDTSNLPRVPDFSCPQVYQRLVVGADGRYMMCSNDERQEVDIGDANVQTIHEVWHGPEMTRIRELHATHRACGKLVPCAQCYLPLQTYDDAVQVGGRSVVAPKYVDGKTRVSDLDTPERWKRPAITI
ncbi:radical SAM/SPASM domain-containing protein [Azospirillum doebereinerae]|uniref:Radical SAM protein n=1 Tax=Azospirillum doebereinerae TaxID=92933 RepID=A0A433J6W4_9PROT|nr:radical SAM/SPASM domain-containing protein [Azospirillum doebereinerae]MCG5238923.1 radical SAM protein [Azospirillum doebereinerae]RUQ68941.1 radical SAM protein [Azospirillum doebereinerae]